jgi:hypothetical protein
MGTFIVSFIGNSFVQWMEEGPVLARLSAPTRRRLLVVVYFTAIASIVTLFGVLTIPDIVREGSDFVQRLQSDTWGVVVLEKMRLGLGCARAMRGHPSVRLSVCPSHAQSPVCLSACLSVPCTVTWPCDRADGHACVPGPCRAVCPSARQHERPRPHPHGTRVGSELQGPL